MRSIPSVDLKEFVSKDPSLKQKFITEIGTAFEEIGFVALVANVGTPLLVKNMLKVKKKAI